MAQYKGKPYTVNMPAANLFGRLSDLSALKEKMSDLPDDLKAKMGSVNFPDAQTVAFTAPGVGEMKFRMVEAVAPSRVRFLADTGVVPINVILDITPEGDLSSAVAATIDADIPMMVRPLIGPKLQEAADKFGEMFGQLNA